MDHRAETADARARGPPSQQHHQDVAATTVEAYGFAGWLASGVGHGDSSFITTFSTTIF